MAGRRLTAGSIGAVIVLATGDPVKTVNRSNPQWDSNLSVAGKIDGCIKAVTGAGTKAKVVSTLYSCLGEAALKIYNKAGILAKNEGFEQATGLWVKGWFAGWVKIMQVGVYTQLISGLNLQNNKKS